MQKKGIKYMIYAGLFLLLAYHSVYFESLSELKAASLERQFDAQSYAQNFWEDELIPALPDAVEINELLSLLEKDQEAAFEAHSNALGIGNIRYFLTRGQGTIISIDENDISLETGTAGQSRKIRIATEFVYGNAVRDASGKIELTDFASTMDLNRVSEEINKKIRTKIIPPFLAAIQTGDSIRFAGAFELNRKFPDPEQIEIIPIDLSLAHEQGRQAGSF